MAEVQQRASREMEPALVLDTTMSETQPIGFTASPLPKAPAVSGPTTEEVEETSGRSNSLSSPATSRPVSGLPENADNAFEEISLMDTSHSQRMSSSQRASAEASRPQSMTNPFDDDQFEEPVSPVDSGSDYSEPSTPKSSRPVSMLPPATNENVSMEDNTQTPVASKTRSIEQVPPATKPSQQWTSLTQSNRGSGQSDLKINTLSQSQSDSESQSSSSVPQTPSITVSPEPGSPEGSNYSDSPPQSPRSPSTPTVPVSPMTPQEAHMSINSLQSIALSDLDEDYSPYSEEQVDNVLSTPRGEWSSALEKAKQFGDFAECLGSTSPSRHALAAKHAI